MFGFWFFGNNPFTSPYYKLIEDLVVENGQYGVKDYSVLNKTGLFEYIGDGTEAEGNPVTEALPATHYNKKGWLRQDDTGNGKGSFRINTQFQSGSVPFNIKYIYDVVVVDGVARSYKTLIADYKANDLVDVYYGYNDLDDANNDIDMYLAASDVAYSLPAGNVYIYGTPPQPLLDALPQAELRHIVSLTHSAQTQPLPGGVTHVNEFAGDGTFGITAVLDITGSDNGITIENPQGWDGYYGDTTNPANGVFPAMAIAESFRNKTGTEKHTNITLPAGVWTIRAAGYHSGYDNDAATQDFDFDGVVKSCKIDSLALEYVEWNITSTGQTFVLKALNSGDAGRAYLGVIELIRTGD